MPYDKRLHFAAGLGISAIGGVFISPIIGLYLAMIAGALKELYDLFDYGLFDVNDMLVTWVGGVAGYIVLLLIK